MNVTHEECFMAIMEYISQIDKNAARLGLSHDEALYLGWGARELLTALSNAPNVPPEYVINGFIDEMDAYSYRDPRTKVIFSSARDAAVCISDILQCCYS